MPILYLALFAGLVVLTAGAQLLVRGASGMALHFGLSRLVVGLTVVAFGTSSPELAVSVKSALDGNGGIALGNIIGSNIFNVAVVLGSSALFCPLIVNFQVVRREIPIMLLASGVFVFFIMGDGTLHRWEGGILMVGIITYTVIAGKQARREVKIIETRPPATTVEVVAGDPDRLPLCIAFCVAGMIMLVAGSELMVRNAVALANLWGVRPAVIGLTIISVGTSLPELATSVVAASRRETDLAVGNIVGSNLFNVLCIAGCAGLAAPISTGDLQWIDIGAMALTSLMLLVLTRTGFRVVRWEGCLLLAVYVAYLYLRWPRA